VDDMQVVALVKSTVRVLDYRRGNLL